MTKGRISPPNYTQIPNAIFDYWMPILSPGEFKVLLAIARKTFGWHKERERISLRQLAELTGLNKRSIKGMVDKLVDHGIVIKIKSTDPFDGSDAPNQYEINVTETDSKEGEKCIKDVPQREFSSPPLGISVPSPPSSASIYKKKKETKERTKGGCDFASPSSSYQKGKFVKLPLEEYDKICEEHGETTVSEIIEEMNDYVEATGKKYKSYGAAIRNWIRRRKGQEKLRWKDPKRNRSQKNADGSDTENQYKDLF